MQTSQTPAPLRPVGPVRGFVLSHDRTLGVASGAFGILLATTGRAVAQATAPTGGIGAQLNAMSSEGMSAGGNMAQAGCYVLALLCFLFGAWAFWQSRQPQNRESGYVLRGAAGLVLCGLLVAAPTWINKAAVTTSGGNATVNGTPGMIQFGGGGGGTGP